MSQYKMSQIGRLR